MVPILMYHQIASSAIAINRLAVPPDAFAAQLAQLHAQGFSTLTASAVAAALAEGTDLPDRAVVLTFDDGFADLYEVALPLLNHYQFTATVYVTTGWIQDAAPPVAQPPPGQMLSWLQIRDLADSGVEIGAHGCSHPELDQLPGRQLEHELRTSKEILETGLGRPVQGMAYPFGYSSARVRRMVREVGYQYACAVGNRIIGSACDPFALPRLTVKRSTRLREFNQVIHGQSLQSLFLKEHVLTKGWAVLRRTRSMRKSFSDD